MANIICKHCDAIITDPCVKINGLIALRIDLLKATQYNPENLEAQRMFEVVNQMIIEVVGIEDSEQDFQIFNTREITSKSKVTIRVFTLKCFRDHIDQYEMECQ